MNEECLICKASLGYLGADEKMECALCHKKQLVTVCGDAPEQNKSWGA